MNNTVCAIRGDNGVVMDFVVRQQRGFCIATNYNDYVVEAYDLDSAISTIEVDFIDDEVIEAIEVVGRI